MKPDIVALVCDPLTHEALQLVSTPGRGEELVNISSGRRFPIRSGIPVFLDSAEVSDQNRRYQRLYDRFAPLYDISTRLYARLKGGGEEKRRREYLDELEIEPGAAVLEVSVGTGANLRYLPRTARYFGLDISWGMLMQCRRHMKSWKLEVDLFQGAAEHLPFVDEAFDAVLHMGGINFFNDKALALSEMVRVARPGTKFVVVDETEDVARRYETTAGAGTFYSNRPEAISAPVDLLPPGMLEVGVKTVGGGDLYCLTFRKPG
jgi:ubiquinone/menaquinone biosynthesis C-methylase UbiE